MFEPKFDGFYWTLFGENGHHVTVPGTEDFTGVTFLLDTTLQYLERRILQG